MIRQSSSSGPCKYLNNQDKKLCKTFLQKKERKKNILKIDINEIIYNKVKFQI